MQLEGGIARPGWAHDLALSSNPKGNLPTLGLFILQKARMNDVQQILKHNNDVNDNSTSDGDTRFC